MPKPNLIEPPDWRAIYEDARAFETWLETGEHPEHVAAMRARRADLPIDAPEAAWLRAVEQPVHVIALAEDWCPDVIRHVPVLQKLADISGDKLHVRYVLRKDNHEVLIRFHTNGTESVPKFGFFNANFVLCGMWGPMPASCRDWIRRGRAAADPTTARERVFAEYNADPDCRVVVAELLQCIALASAVRV